MLDERAVCMETCDDMDMMSKAHPGIMDTAYSTAVEVPAMRLLENSVDSAYA